MKVEGDAKLGSSRNVRPSLLGSSRHDIHPVTWSFHRSFSRPERFRAGIWLYWSGEHVGHSRLGLVAGRYPGALFFPSGDVCPQMGTSRFDLLFCRNRAFLALGGNLGFRCTRCGSSLLER